MPSLIPSSSSVTRPLARSLTLALSPVAAVVLLASACSNASPKYPDLTSFCAGVANAECNSTVLLACAISTPDVCAGNEESACAGRQPPGTSYNAAAGEGCVNAYAAAYADAKVTLAETNNINQACVEVFEGVGIKNASCVADSDCQVGMGLRCVMGSAGTSTCQVPQSVTGGGSCAAPDQQCVAGYHCGSTAHCDIDGAATDACSATLPCGAGLMCDLAATNMCIAKGADGSACTTGDQCANGICSIAMSMASGLCVSQVTIAPDEPFCVDARKM
jgi:hypothetical protein